jgi:hypothetical protein
VRPFAGRMTDVWFVLLTIAVFVVVGLAVRALERL